MKLNIKEMALIINKINNLIEEYELNHLSYYNELNSISSIWSDINSENLVKESVDQKVKINVFIDFLKNYCLIYNHLINELSYLGDDLKFVFENQEKLLSKLDEIIKIHEEILEIFNTIYELDDDILREQDEIKKYYDMLITLKDFILETFDKANNSALLMKKRMNELDMTVIKEETLI